MIVSVPKETIPSETRVALTPDVVKRLVSDGVTARVETGAGEAAWFSDDAYRDAGAEVAARDAIWNGEIIVKVNPPTTQEVTSLASGSVLVGMLQPLVNLDLISELAKQNVTTFSLDALPRISRAQSMDALSSMSTVQGYKAVLLAAASLGRFFPMLMTAAGTIIPAKVLVLGAGVAGLQAIATARRLGAVVSAFDVRPVVKEQVESLGARFIAAEAMNEEAAGAGGYAKQLSDEQHQRELELIHDNIKDMDAVITTALIPGKRAPILITEEMVSDMKPGSVVIDLAAEMGGNCAITKPGEDVVHHGVKVVGPLNLPASMPTHASQMYAKNMATFLGHVTKDGELHLDFDDEITSGTCITKDTRVIHEATRKALNGRNGT